MSGLATTDVHFQQVLACKVQVSKITRGSGSSKRFTRGEATCRCGWHTPTIITNESDLDKLVAAHLKEASRGV